MEIIMLKEQGFCKGVEIALDKSLKTVKNEKNIYFLGDIIHNKYVVEQFKKYDVIFLGNDNKEQTLSKIKNKTVIFQAHGSSEKCYDIAKKNNLKVIDCTCPYVKIIHNNIKKYSNEGYTIIYIGKPNHEETVASISYANNIYPVYSLNDVKNLKINSTKIYVTNQTTLSLYDLNEIFDEILKKYPNAILDNKICLATTKRQECVINQENVDLAIIIGDKNSSNSHRLYELSKIKNKSIFIENVVELKNLDFSNIKKVSITSGASTPKELVNEVYNYLISLN